MDPRGQHPRIGRRAYGDLHPSNLVGGTARPRVRDPDTGGTRPIGRCTAPHPGPNVRLAGVLVGLATLLMAVGTHRVAAQVDESGPTGRVRIEAAAGTHEVRVEIAETPASRAVGLMGREELAQDAGMLFLFETDRPANAGFYMYRTHIPLDIAFADAGGRIVAILTMDPCTRSQWFCPGYPPGAPYRMALEVNAGFFAERGIAVGDRLHLKRSSS
jgi:uncharacterized protein